MNYNEKLVKLKFVYVVIYCMVYWILNLLRFALHPVSLQNIKANLSLEVFVVSTLPTNFITTKRRH
jgi:hypothetical protein